MGKIHDIADFKLEKFNERFRISTVGFLIQQYYNAVHKEYKDKTKRLTKFVAYMGKYEIKMAQYKQFVDLHWRASSYDSIIKSFETAKVPRTRATILTYIFQHWNLNTSTEEKNSLESSVKNIDKYTAADQGIYMPHPLDGMFVIDTASHLRKLDLLESRIEKTLQNQPVQTSSTSSSTPPNESFASVVNTMPRATPAVKVAGKRCAVYVAAQKGTTKEQLEEKCKEKFKKYDLKVEKLSAETVTSNFRVTCENWPTNLDMSKCEQWHSFNVKVRPWHGPIQSLDLKPKIRRLISRIDSNTTVEEIKNKIKNIFGNSDDICVQIQEFVHKIHNNKYKNYVIEISSNSKINVVDKLTPYCQQNAITIRPWKGKLPSLSFPRFI